MHTCVIVIIVSELAFVYEVVVLDTETVAETYVIIL